MVSYRSISEENISESATKRLFFHDNERATDPVICYRFIQLKTAGDFAAKHRPNGTRLSPLQEASPGEKLQNGASPGEKLQNGTKVIFSASFWMAVVPSKLFSAIVPFSAAIVPFLS